MNLIELGEILHMEKGKKPSAYSSEQREGYLPYVDIKAFEQGIIDNFVSPLKTVLCNDGDLLIVCDGSRSGLTGIAIKGVVGSTLAKISADGVLIEYLRYFIQSKYALLNTRKKGTGTPHLNVELLKKSKLSVPSIQEQKQIVERIEELFSKLDKAEETLLKTKSQLKVYRQAAITEAFPVMTQENSVRLDEISSVVGGITKGRKLDGCDVLELPYLRVANVQNGYLDLSEIKRIRLKKQEKEKYLLQYGDVLYTEGGDRDKLGRGTVWKDEIPECVHQNHVFKARLDQSMAIPKYVAYWSMSTPARYYFYQKGKQSVNLASINKSVLSALELPLPTLDKQKSVVRQIEAQMTMASKIEESVDRALAETEALRKSILKQAFEGEL